MKQYKQLVINVDVDLADEIIAIDRQNFFTPNQTEDNQAYYLRLIDKEDFIIHDGKVVYGNGLVLLDPGRTVVNAPSILKSGDLTMNFMTGIITKKGVELKLSFVQQLLLEMFVRNSNRILSRGQLISTLESASKIEITDNTLTVHIYRLRQALGKYRGKGYIKTHNSVGYSWEHVVY